MIIKSKSRRTNSFPQLVNYILHDKGRVTGNHAFVLTQNLKGNSGEEWIKELRGNEDYQFKIRKNATRVIHEIISFHVKDTNKLKPEILEDLTREYMRLRSPEGMFLAVPHLQDAHLHIHIAGSPWELRSSKSLRMSKKEFMSLKRKIQEYQMERYPELTHSIVEHGRQSPSKTIDPRSVPKEYSIRHNLISLMQKALKQGSDLLDYVRFFQCEGYEVYERRGVPQGLIVGGKKYRFTRLMPAAKMSRERISQEISQSLEH